MTTLANLTTYFAGESASLLSAIKESRGGLRSLIAQLDPAAAATDRFNKRQTMLDNALKRGKLTLEQHAILTRRLKDQYDAQAAGMTRVIGVSGTMRGGMQQLSFQLNDMATMWSMGARPMQIFASQAGQVIQSMQMMSGGSKGLIGFLGGPWGMALTTAAVVLTPFIAKLMEGSDIAAELKDRLADAADGADAFGDAQSLLGRMVDLTTGKLKDHNDVLRATIRLQAMLNKQQAAQERETAQELIEGEAKRRVGGFAAMTPGGTGVGQATPSRFRSPQATMLARWVLAGSMPIDEAVRQLGLLNDAGKVAKDTFDVLSSQFVEFGQAAEKGEAAQAILDYLDGKGLDPRLREEPPKARERKTRAPNDRTAEFAERYLNELNALRAEQIDLQQRLTNDLQERAMLEHQRVADDQVAYNRSLQRRVADGELTAAQAERLRIANDENVESQHRLINYRLDDDLAADALGLRRATLDMQAEQLNHAYSAARTDRERRAIALKLLALSMERARLEQQAILNSHTASEAERRIAEAKLAQLGMLQQIGAARIGREHGGPMARYLDSLPRTAEEANEAYQRAAADGLSTFNDGLAEAIAGTKSLGEVFGDVANQIIADLARIMIQRAITKPLADALFGSGGFLSGLFGGGGSSASLAGGLVPFAGDIPGRARGGPVERGAAYIVGEVGPELFVPNASGRIVPNDALRGGGPNGSPIVFDLRGAVMTEDLLRQMNDMADGAAVRGATGGAALAQRQGRRARRRALA